MISRPGLRPNTVNRLRSPPSRLGPPTRRSGAVSRAVLGLEPPWRSRTHLPNSSRPRDSIVPKARNDSVEPPLRFGFAYPHSAPLCLTLAEPRRGNRRRGKHNSSAFIWPAATANLRSDASLGHDIELHASPHHLCHSTPSRSGAAHDNTRPCGASR